MEHYSEDGNDYEESLAELQDLRQAMRTPTRQRDTGPLSIIIFFFPLNNYLLYHYFLHYSEVPL